MSTCLGHIVLATKGHNMIWLLILVLSAAVAEEIKDPLPASAKAALQSYAAEMDRSEAARKASQDAIRTMTLRTLETARDAAERSKNDAAATAILDAWTAVSGNKIPNYVWPIDHRSIMGRAFADVPSIGCWKGTVKPNEVFPLTGVVRGFIVVIPNPGDKWGMMAGESSDFKGSGYSPYSSSGGPVVSGGPQRSVFNNTMLLRFVDDRGLVQMVPVDPEKPVEVSGRDAAIGSQRALTMDGRMAYMSAAYTGGIDIKVFILKRP